ncbi:MAG: NAD(P)/FAD-dependent oxidoreductase [Bacteroidetes bacterium]|nr:NAD(P)/FAD-dependent oxidoreductase [Bacteroidota bacterium]
MEFTVTIPPTKHQRIVIIGAGFGGLKLARMLVNTQYQLIILDKNNEHQFQPLFYHIATSGLEPSSICFPLQKIFQKEKNVIILQATVEAIDSDKNSISTSIGSIEYDYLVIATGCDTNYFGNATIMKHAFGMKSVSEALSLRNHILQNLRNHTHHQDKHEKYLNLVIVGGGPTGFEIAGTLADLRNHILPNDCQEVDFSKLRISLIHSGERLLATYDTKSSENAKTYLEDSGVQIQLNTKVIGYDGAVVALADGAVIPSNTLIWVAGVTGNKIEGLRAESIIYGNRYRVNEFNMLEGYNNIFAIGDISFQVDKDSPGGHPQLAQVAIQQGKELADNLKRLLQKKAMRPFIYIDYGTMASAGRNKAIFEMGKLKIYGAVAWFIWMFIHLMALLGVKNKILTFLNWAWSYINFNKNLRQRIKQEIKPE